MAEALFYFLDGGLERQALWHCAADLRDRIANVNRNFFVAIYRGLLAANILLSNNVSCKIHLEIIGRKLEWASSIEYLLVRL